MLHPTKKHSLPCVRKDENLQLLKSRHFLRSSATLAKRGGSQPWARLGLHWIARNFVAKTFAFVENFGLSPIEEVAAAKSRQLKEGCPFIGLGIMQDPTEDGYHSCNMKDVGVFETLIGKQEQ